MSAPRRAASTTTHRGRWEISQESRNTFAENMGRRNGNVTSAQRSMQFNPIGKLTPKHVALGNTDVTVAPFFQGKFSHLVKFKI